MKNFLKVLAVMLFAVTFFTACQKEEMLSSKQNVDQPLFAQSNGEQQQSEYSEQEVVEAQEAGMAIKAMKDQMDAWAQGENTDVKMKADKAVDQIEMVWNFYVSRPDQMYKEYHTFNGTMKLEMSGSEDWDGNNIAYVYKKFKEKVVKSMQEVGTEDTGINIMDLKKPTINGNKVMIDYSVVIGKGKIAEPITSFWEKRWAGDPLGFTTVSCTGRANDIIGAAVNSNIGFYLDNLPPPNPPQSGNQKPGTFIIGPVQQAQINFFGTEFPLGGGPGALIVNKTTDFPTGNTQSPNYPNVGQYVVHADPAFTPTLPDENCFSINKLINYSIDNKDYGESLVPQINALAPPSFPFFLPYQLLSTYVGASAQAIDNPLTPDPIDVRLQEHPTYHFYGKVFKFIIFEPAPVLVAAM